MANLSLFPLAIESDYQTQADLILHQGEVERFLPQLPDESVHLIITSPPYNLGKAYETRQAIEDYLEQQQVILQSLYRVLSPTGSLCWQVGNFVEDGEIYPLDLLYYPLFKRLGFKLRNRIIWHFRHGLHASKRFSGRYETILWFTKSDHYTFNLDDVRVPSKYPGKRHYKGPHKGLPSGNPKGKNPSDLWEVVLQDWEQEIWDIPNVKANHPEKTTHPCQFPVELVERCLLALTNPGDVLFDPFAGVGSSLIAAYKHGRVGIGCEKEADYVMLARERLQAFADGKLALRPLGKPVHEPTGREKVAQLPQEWHEEDLL
jgi:adenine-specific DNA-methyltransferase